MWMPPLRRLDLWLPPLLLMAAIFYLSAQPNLDSGLGTVDLIGRKLVHFGEYALLCLLWWRALAPSAGGAAGGADRLPPRKRLRGDATSSTRASSTTRNGSPLDWAIDTAGAAAAALWIRSPGEHALTGGRLMLRRLPIESAQPVVVFATARLALVVLALVGVVSTGFPYDGRTAAVLGLVALPWAWRTSCSRAGRPSRR